MAWDLEIIIHVLENNGGGIYVREYLSPEEILVDFITKLARLINDHRLIKITIYRRYLRQ